MNIHETIMNLILITIITTSESKNEKVPIASLLTEVFILLSCSETMTNYLYDKLSPFTSDYMSIHSYITQNC